MRVRDVILLFIFASIITCEFHHVDCAKEKQRRPKDRRRAQSSPKGNDRGVITGKSSLKDGSQCTWVTAGEGDRFVLRVTCARGGKRFGCGYAVMPSSCPQYSSNPDGYWKQMARSLRRQKGLCLDSSVRVKTGMCRSGPERAHFRLMSAEVTSPPPGPLCPQRVRRQRLAEEFCTRSWSSLCTFLFLMVENDECN